MHTPVMPDRNYGTGGRGWVRIVVPNLKHSATRHYTPELTAMIFTVTQKSTFYDKDRAPTLTLKPPTYTNLDEVPSSSLLPNGKARILGNTDQYIVKIS
jgi:hypothetical protein